MSNNQKALKSGLWYTISNFFVRSIGILTTPIFTRLLSKEEFGQYSNYTSWLGILTILITLNLESTLMSARYDFEKKFDEYILSVLSLSSVSVVVWTTLLNVFHEFCSDYFMMDQIYINSMMVYLLLYPVVNIFQIRERYFFRYKNSVLLSVAISITTALLSVILVLFMKERLMGRVIGSILPTILIGIVLYVFFVIKGKRIDCSYWKYALKICIPYIPHLLSLTMLNSMDRVMITKICGANDTALYSLAYNCGALVTLLVTSLNSAYSPWLGEQLSKKNYTEIRSFSKKYIVIFVYLAIGVMLVAPEILFILGGKDYLEAKYLMIPVAIGCACQFLYTLFVNIEQFEKRTIGMAFASVSAAVLNYGLNLWAIPKFGYVSAAYTTLAGFIWLLIVHMFLVYKLNMSCVYSYKFVIGITLMLLLTIPVVNILYIYDIIRYLTIVVYALIFLYVIIKNKTLILAFFKKG